MSSRKTSSAQVELVLLPGLRNCLLNLPPSLVAVLLNSNTIAQNVIVELSYRQAATPSQDAKQKTTGVTKSVFLGWTGMQSQSKQAPLVGRDGSLAQARAGGRQEQEVATVEVDSTFGRLLGLNEGMKVRLCGPGSRGEGIRLI